MTKNNYLNFIRTAILVHLSHQFKDELIKHNYQSKPEGALNGLRFYLEIPTKQKAHIIKKIIELKGMTKMRFNSEQTDYIVVDHEFLKSDNHGHHHIKSKTQSKQHFNYERMTDLKFDSNLNWLNSENVSSTFKNFVKKESQNIYQQVEKVILSNSE